MYRLTLVGANRISCCIPCNDVSCTDGHGLVSASSRIKWYVSRSRSLKGIAVRNAWNQSLKCVFSLPYPELQLRAQRCNQRVNNVACAAMRLRTTVVEENLDGRK